MHIVKCFLIAPSVHTGYKEIECASTVSEGDKFDSRPPVQNAF